MDLEDLMKSTLSDFNDKLDKEKIWDKRFIELADLISTWSSCIREGRQVGAVIIKGHRVMTTGYNGAPSGVVSCRERKECLRDKKHIESGSNLEVCYASHAEQNAIVQAAKLGISIDDSVLYCTHKPCSLCTKLIINSGIKRVVYRHDYPDEFSMKLFNEAGVKIEKYDD